MAKLRGDKVLWLDAHRLSSLPHLGSLTATMDDFVEGGLKTRAARLGDLKGRTDAMLTDYPGKGARYVKHVDNTHADGRILTAIVYLNPDWKTEDGGLLRLHPMGTQLMTAAGFTPSSKQLPQDTSQKSTTMKWESRPFDPASSGHPYGRSLRLPHLLRLLENAA